MRHRFFGCFVHQKAEIAASGLRGFCARQNRLSCRFMQIDFAARKKKGFAARTERHHLHAERFAVKGDACIQVSDRKYDVIRL